MSKKAEYKSALRSRKLIRQAFVALLQEKPIEKITVTDIVTRADINRGTFYAHYQDTRAVIEQIENEIIETMLEFLGEFRYKNFFQNPLPLLEKISHYLEEDLDFFRILINAKGSEQFLLKLKNVFVRHMETDSDVPTAFKHTPAFIVRSNFFAGGLVNLYQMWFRGEMDCSLKEISVEISKIIANNVLPDTGS
ncbi:MAG: TetR/AcrR family transcriptional regulator C-terminal domain-containing protein [Anaerolineales bacterium]|nr:TetR/AcrR family transcriptional regulator C-terminal domain-containing protein [Anaerolineales bacterium]